MRITFLILITILFNNCFSNSVLNSGDWYKIQVGKTGVHKISFNELKEAGIKNPNNIKIYGYGGGQLSVKLHKKFDKLPSVQTLIKNSSVYFYAESKYELIFNNSKVTHKMNNYDEKSYYFITENNLAQKTISTQNILNSTSNFETNYYNSYSFIENNNISLLKTGEDLFEKSVAASQTKTYKIDLLNKLSENNIDVTISYVTKKNNNATMDVTIENQSYNIPSTSKSKYKLITNTKKLSVNSNKFNIVLTNYNAGSHLNYISINSKCKLEFDNAQYNFRNFNSVSTNKITKFNIATSSAPTIWDITDTHNITNQKTTNNGSATIFVTKTNTLKEFVMFNDNSAYKIEDIKKIGNQNLHSLSNIHMIIVTPPKFFEEAKKLAIFHHKNSGDTLIVKCISTDQIFNEFSSGRYSATAIRNFMKMLYDKASSDNKGIKPQYLLLFGDGSYYNRTKGANRIPVYNSANSTSKDYSFVSDDYYALLEDGNGGAIIGDAKLNLAVGRLPINTTEQAKNAVEKIINYSTNKEYFGGWRNTICFSADDADDYQSIHVRDAENIANSLIKKTKKYNIKKVYLDSFQQHTSSAEESYPEASKKLLSVINNGVFVLNYLGHGSPTRLSHETLIDISDIKLLKNKKKLGIWIVGACDFAPYQEHESTSSGEELIINKHGGAIALISTSKYSYTSENKAISREFFTLLAENKYYRIGDIIKNSKNHLVNEVSLKDKFILLGDPALKIKYHNKNIKYTSINNIKRTSTAVDTVNSLELLSFDCEVNYNSSIQTSFNGEVEYTVFDKPISLKTIDNDKIGIKVEFKSQENILFKGKAKVKNGKFNFNFIIPKDISYSSGNLKIFYYCYNNSEIASGINFLNIKSGSNSTNSDDLTGPQIRLFLNDTTFKDGDKINNEPLLITKLYDKNGINLSTASIGHEITISINDGSPITLNSQYRGESYQKGEIHFLLPKQEKGANTLSVKAWDVYNNSGESKLNYFVTEKFTIYDLINYPNPFKKTTTIRLKHNKINIILKEIKIEIYSLTGEKVLQIIKNDILSEENKIDNIEIGSELESGTYIARIYIETDDNLIANKTIIIVKTK